MNLLSVSLQAEGTTNPKDWGKVYWLMLDYLKVARAAVSRTCLVSAIAVSPFNCHEKRRYMSVIACSVCTTLNHLHHHLCDCKTASFAQKGLP